MFYSVIIPALNEEKTIERTIQCLKTQNFNKDQFEIIVVDNASTDKTSEVAQHAGAITVLEKTKGTNIARNRGIKEGKGDILVFLDADCEPHESWLTIIDSLISNNSIDAISGPYDYGFTGIQRILSIVVYDYGFEIVGPIMSFCFRKKVCAMMGGNFAVKRTAINEIGEFPAITFWGDDTAISMKLMAKGKKVSFTRMLKIKSSDRRFSSQGFVHSSFVYFYHFFKMYFTFPV